MCKKEFLQRLLHFPSSNLVLESFKDKQSKLERYNRRAEGFIASLCVK